MKYLYSDESSGFKNSLVGDWVHAIPQIMHQKTVQKHTGGFIPNVVFGENWKIPVFKISYCSRPINSSPHNAYGMCLVSTNQSQISWTFKLLQIYTVFFLTITVMDTLFFSPGGKVWSGVQSLNFQQKNNYQHWRGGVWSGVQSCFTRRHRYCYFRLGEEGRFQYCRHRRYHHLSPRPHFQYRWWWICWRRRPSWPWSSFSSILLHQRWWSLCECTFNGNLLHKCGSCTRSTLLVGSDLLSILSIPRSMLHSTWNRIGV